MKINCFADNFICHKGNKTKNKNFVFFVPSGKILCRKTTPFLTAFIFHDILKYLPADQNTLSTAGLL
jgi:hypothetical protein